MVFNKQLFCHYASKQTFVQRSSRVRMHIQKVRRGRDFSLYKQKTICVFLKLDIFFLLVDVSQRYCLTG